MIPIGHIGMKQQEMFRSWLDHIINMNSVAVKIAIRSHGGRLAEISGESNSDNPGLATLPTRLITGLPILNFAHVLSAVQIVGMYLQQLHFRYFRVQEFSLQAIPLFCSPMTLWRMQVDEEKMPALIRESPDIACQKAGAESSKFSWVIVDSTVQPAIGAKQTGAGLTRKTRNLPVTLAKADRIQLRQKTKYESSNTVSPWQGHYDHTRRFRGTGKKFHRVGNYLRRTPWHIPRRIGGNPVLQEIFVPLLRGTERILTRRSFDLVARCNYSRHAPKIERIDKGLVHRSWKFGVKLLGVYPVKKSGGGRIVKHFKTLPGKHRDGHKLSKVIPELETVTRLVLQQMAAARGCWGHYASKSHKLLFVVTWQHQGVTAALVKYLSRQNFAVPVPGHVKNEHRREHCYLAFENTALASVRYDFPSAVQVGKKYNAPFSRKACFEPSPCIGRSIFQLGSLVFAVITNCRSLISTN